MGKIPAVTCAEETCRAQFIYLKNPKTGKSVPVDVDSLSEDDVAEIEACGPSSGVEYDENRHVSHFTTCTNPGRFSRRKGDK